MHRLSFKVIISVIFFVIMVIAATDIVISADAKDDKNTHPHLNPLPEGEEITLPFKGRDKVGMGFSDEKRIEAKKGIVAFIELSSPTPSDVYLLYPTQYNKYKTSGSLEGAIEFKDITWLFYPIPALLEDQTVYIITKGEVILILHTRTFRRGLTVYLPERSSYGQALRCQ